MKTPLDAKQALDTLMKKEILSPKEILQAFQLSLALGNTAQAYLLQDTYNEAVHEALFHTLCTIDSKESILLFKSYRHYWDSCNRNSPYIQHKSKLYYSAILLQQDIASKYELSLELGLNEKDKELLLEAHRTKLVSLHPSELLEKIKHANTKVQLEALPELLLKTESLELVDYFLDNYKCSEDDRVKILIYKAKLLSRPDTKKAIEIIVKADQGYRMRETIKEGKYELACLFAKDGRIKDATLLMHSIRDIEYFYGLQAAIAVGKKDKKLAARIVGCIYGLRGMLNSENIHSTHYILIIKHALIHIASLWPELAFGLYKRACELDEKGICSDSEILIAIFPYYPDKVLDMIGKIYTVAGPNDSEHWFYPETLTALAFLAKDEKLLIRLIKMVDLIDSPPLKYSAMKALEQKLPISFEDMYIVCSKISPYDYIIYDKETYRAKCKQLFSLPYGGANISPNRYRPLCEVEVIYPE